MCEGKINNDVKNSLEIDEMPENEVHEEFFSKPNEINLSQQNSTGGLITTPRMNEPNQQKEKENILFVRKSHELGFSYYNQHAKKKSFDINPLNNNIIDDSKAQEKEKKKVNTTVLKNKNISITPNSLKSKENRSLTPNTKDQMKFEGKIKKSVQRQFIKNPEEKKNTTFRKK